MEVDDEASSDTEKSPGEQPEPLPKTYSVTGREAVTAAAAAAAGAAAVVQPAETEPGAQAMMEYEVPQELLYDVAETTPEDQEDGGTELYENIQYHAAIDM